jgi:CRISPR-associated exonuclease Cas4
MRDYRDAGKIPQIKPKQVCNGCSMKDLCIPSAYKKRSNIKDSIMQFSEDEI